MCSIIGWNGKFNEELVESLCFNSRIRGLHSFGYSYVLNSQVIVKKFLDYDEFLTSLKTDRPNKFIAHFRYSTSGDYKEQNNNQPILRDDLAMVFNGVLDMRTKQEMQEAYNVEMNTDNDGELAVIHKMRSEQEFIEFVKNKSFAGAFIDATGEIQVFRNNNRPAHIGEHNGIRILSSTKDILHRSRINSTKIVGYNKFISF